MDQRVTDTPDQVLQFAPRGNLGPLEETGLVILEKIRKAADLSKEDCDRAMTMAHKLSIRLRGAEERLPELQKEVNVLRERAARAEGWLQTIQKEIEEKLIAPRSAAFNEPPSLN